MNVLHICANPKPLQESVSKQLATAFISTLIERNPEVEVTNVDLYQDVPPYLNYKAFRGAWMPVFDAAYEPAKEETAALAYADKHAALVNAADVLVLTMPMWNFTVPAIMKSWMDAVLMPNRTFTFTAEGPKPLHHIRKAVLLVASGGVYKEDDPRDALSPQVRSALAFIGIEDVAVAWADGQTALFFPDHEDRKQAALDAANEIAEDVAELAGAAG